MESIIRDIVPKISMESPTAKKVNISLIGFLMLDLMVRPTVVGRREVSLCIPREESLTSCWPLSISRGCILEASRAGLIPAIRTTPIAITKFCTMRGASVWKPMAGMPRRSSYIATIAGPPNAAPSTMPMEEPISPMAIGASMNPGIIADFGTPRVRRMAISRACD